MTTRVFVLCTLLMGCKSGESTLEGQVIDIWGGAIAEATVMVGTGATVTTDAHGYFSVPNPGQALTLRIGKEGYVQDELNVTAGDNGELPSPVIELYPRPDEHGFFVVGQTAYKRVDPEPIRVIGNALSKVSGLSKIDLRTGRSPFEVVFATELRMEEIRRLGLELHSLTYSAKVMVEGPFGTEAADANLYTSSGVVDIDITPMRSRNAYLISVSGLEPGWYAFQIQDVLDPNNASNLATLPEAQKVAWAFEYKP